jgi:hypothetical protein
MKGNAMTTDEQTELNLAWRTLVQAVGLESKWIPELHERGLLTVQSIEAITAVAKAVIENNRQWVIDQHLVGPFNAMADEIKSWRFHSHVETDGQSVRYVFPVGNARQLAAAQRATDTSGALTKSRNDTANKLRELELLVSVMRDEIKSWRATNKQHDLIGNTLDANAWNSLLTTMAATDSLNALENER